MLGIVDWTIRDKFQWNFNKNKKFSLKKKHLKILSMKWGPFCSGGDELILSSCASSIHLMEIKNLWIVSTDITKIKLEFPFSFTGLVTHFMLMKSNENCFLRTLEKAYHVITILIIFCTWPFYKFYYKNASYLPWGITVNGILPDHIWLRYSSDGSWYYNHASGAWFELNI